jgi:hypothetical protein
MCDQLTPLQAWQSRVQELVGVLARLRNIFLAEPDPVGLKRWAGLYTIFERLERALQELIKLEQHPDVQERWSALIQTQAIFQAHAQLLGELLGSMTLRQQLYRRGVGKPHNLLSLAEAWLPRTSSDPQFAPSIIPALGPLYEAQAPHSGAYELSLVRLPFLEEGWWDLPLATRAAGLHAMRSKFEGQTAFLDALSPASRALLQGFPRSPHDQPELPFSASFLTHLAADLYAAARIGPAYALAVFALELDYGDPTSFGLENPDQIEGREIAARCTPSGAQRAAAILLALELAGNSAQELEQLISRLKAIWRASLGIDTAGDLLDATCQDHRELLRVLYMAAVAPDVTPGLLLPTWRRTQEWFRYLSDHTANLPSQADVTAFSGNTLSEIAAWELSALLGAIWWHRYQYPSQAVNISQSFSTLVIGQSGVTPYAEAQAESLAGLAFVARLGRLHARRDRLLEILTSNIFPERDRRSVTGRFYQLASQFDYHLEKAGTTFQSQGQTQTSWQALEHARQKSLSLQREALEFIGGVMLRQAGLDREIPTFSGYDGQPPIPAICNLADHLLGDIARLTGVNWEARTIPGTSPFIAGSTSVIRVGFPDWSLWNLPLLAHEFGHVVTKQTPAYERLRWELARQAATSVDNAQKQATYETAQRHLEEYFCDIFATYCLGPAFVLQMALIQFKPLNAHRQSSSHPTPSERIEAVLAMLGEMRHPTYGQVYQPVIELTQDAWQATISDHGYLIEEPPDLPARIARARTWGLALYQLVDEHFRLGAAYQPVQWTKATTAAKRILDETQSPPTLQTLTQIYSQRPDSPLVLRDLLNGLWWARICGGMPGNLRLNRLAHELVSTFYQQEHP